MKIGNLQTPSPSIPARLNRLLAYSALFGAAVALARAVPQQWSSFLGGVVIASVVICGYALLTKVFPDHIGAGYNLARLEEPYGYWNATGLTAATGVIGCLWLGSRRSGHDALTALAFPALGLMLVTLVLTYSRGALLALAIGLILWFCVVPLRVRSGTLLLAASALAAPVVAWYLSRPALSGDNEVMAERIGAGREFGALLVAMLILLAVVGLIVGFTTARSRPSPRTRRRVGAAMLSLPALALLVVLGALVVSPRGPIGTISHAVHNLTSPRAKLPSNDAGRLTAISSERARYWEEALKVFGAHPALGSGADSYRTARLRYRTVALDVGQAHGYIVQTLSDLGLVGLAGTLALLAAWMAAAGRCTHPFGRRWSAWRWRRHDALYTPERIGMLALLCLVVVFGVHSTVDWTWYTPGTACVALLCAGWLAGRGPLSQQQHSPGRHPGVLALGRPDIARLVERLRTDPILRGRTGVAAVIVAFCALAASQLEPQRSVNAQDEALELATSNPRKALDKAHAAVSDDPLSADALYALASVEQASGDRAEARKALRKAVELQPSNPATWQRLGEFDLGAGQSAAALGELRAAMYLNIRAGAPRAEIEGHPELLALQEAYLRALRTTTSPTH